LLHVCTPSSNPASQNSPPGSSTAGADNQPAAGGISLPISNTQPISTDNQVLQLLNLQEIISLLPMDNPRQWLSSLPRMVNLLQTSSLLLMGNLQLRSFSPPTMDLPPTGNPMVTQKAMARQSTNLRQ